MIYDHGKKIITEKQDQIIAWRRHLHQYPELSFEEFETSDYIADQLTEMGYEPRRGVGGTGVMAVLETGRPGPVIAFRAELDALPVLEDTGLDFASKRTGVMHACGHDGHMAILLGTAAVLYEMRESLCGTVKFIFQPGEEGNGGAKCVISDNVLRDPDVEGIFALHMIPELPAGVIGVKEGYLSATDDEFIIDVRGKTGHSSEPETAVNAVTIAAYIVTALQQIIGSSISPFETAALSVCQIRGGEAINVIPDSAQMKGMLRCVRREDKFHIRDRMRQIVENTAAACGGNAGVTFIEGFPSVNNDSALTRLVAEEAEKVLGSGGVVHIKRPHMGSEDFAYFQQEIPGVIFMLGCAKEGEVSGGLHCPDLNISEDSLCCGVSVFTAVALRLCGR